MLTERRRSHARLERGSLGGSGPDRALGTAQETKGRVIDASQITSCLAS